MKARKINAYLNKKLQKAGLYTEIEVLSEREVSISIEWGDWKHDHGALRFIMKNEGYYETNQVVTEEDGGDCYSAIHYFTKSA